MAGCPRAPAFVFGTNGLGAVLDDNQPMPPSNLHHTVHFCHLAVEMDRDHCTGAGCDLGFDLCRIDVVSGGVNVHKHGLGPPRRAIAPTVAKNV